MGGCITVKVASQVTCLPMVAYTADQQKAAADAVKALSPDSPLVAFVIDYGAMRAADRACISSNTPTGSHK